jgi:hypothetical protein
MGHAVNTDSPEARKSLEASAQMARELRTCIVCGAKFSATEENELCPVCLLREALAAAGESSATSSADAANPPPDHATERFEHYELVLDRGRLSTRVGPGCHGHYLQGS